MSLSQSEDPFTCQLEEIKIIDDEYIVLKVFHGHGNFESSRFRNEIHFKSKHLTSDWLAALNELKGWDPISIELIDGVRMIISQGEYSESQEMLGTIVYYYEEKHIPLDPLDILINITNV